MSKEKEQSKTKVDALNTAKKAAEKARKDAVRMFNITGRQEIATQRIMILSGIVFIGLLLVVLWALSLVSQLENDVRAAESEKYTFAFPSSDGVFISSKVMPLAHVKAMIKDYNNNRYNFTKDSVTENLNYAKRMMEPEFLIKEDPKLKKTIKLSISQDISQVFGIMNKRLQIEEKPDGFTVKFDARRKRYSGNEEYEDVIVRVIYNIVKVRPSQYYNWGLMIKNVSVKSAK